MNLTEALLHALKAHGAREIFGIPGDFALPYFKVIEESGILPLYTLSHEPGVGFAADAAGRSSTGLGVAAVTYGAGAFNLVNAVAGAYAERSPLVVLSGAPAAAERATGLLLHHQARTIETQFRVYREITCDQAVLDDPTTAPGGGPCSEAANDPAGLHRNPAGPAAPPAPVEACRPRPSTSTPDACADESSRLKQARSPVLMVGVEEGYGIEDKARLPPRMPVVTSFMGRGLLANSCGPRTLSQACRPGDHRAGRASALLAIVISTRISACRRGRRSARPSGPRAAGAWAITSIQFRSRPWSRLLKDSAGAGGPQFSANRLSAGLQADSEPVSPDIARAVNDLARIVHAGRRMGDCLFTAMDFRHTPVVAPGYYAGIGLGVPAGLGLQASSGERPLILVGDGAFQMTGWELGNCRRYGWDPVVLVFQHGWEMLRRSIRTPAQRRRLALADIAASLGKWEAVMTGPSWRRRSTGRSPSAAAFT
jgi:indolepyruvate decarboxylase